MKRGVLLQRGNGAAAEVAHAGAQAADELEDHRFERAAMGNAAFDAFGNELGETVAAVAAADVDDAFAAVQLGLVEIPRALEVAFARALRHR